MCHMFPPNGVPAGTQLPSGIPLVKMQTGTGIMGDQQIVTLHLHTPAGVFAVFVPKVVMETQIIPQLKALCSGLTIPGV